MITPAAPTEFTTRFSWTPRRSRKLSLLSFLAASVVLHALCFYIFQIIYPPAAAPPSPPARVSMITPGTEEGRVLLGWIEAEDPALSSTTQRPPNAAAFVPPKHDYVASFANRLPPLKQLPPLEHDLRVPSARPPAPVPPQFIRTPSIAAAVPTTVDVSDPHDSLGAPQFPSFQFTSASNEPPQAATFRIGVNARGAVQHCFLQQSSGDSALDEQAHRYLLLTRFPAVNTPDLGWTTASVNWGNDIAPAPANAVEPAAP